jgi:alkylation response protein AidB-like acyl-CoA dehydrogenase
MVDTHMDSALTRTQKEIQKAAREFARGEFDATTAQEMDQREEFPRAIWERAAELGFIGLHFPEKYGGGGLGLCETVLVAESLCRRNSTVGIALMLADIAADALYLSGSEEQKAKYLPALFEGRLLSGMALADLGGEPCGNADCTAIPGTREGIVEISGWKGLVVNGKAAGLLLLLCREAASTNTYSLYLVEREGEIPLLQPCAAPLGMRLSALAGLQLAGTRLAVNKRLGGEAVGLRQLALARPYLHIRLAAMALGIARGALDRSLNYARERIQFGGPIARFQAVRHKLADMTLLVAQARCLTEAAARQLDAQRPDAGLAAAAKLGAARAALTVAYEAIQLHGGYGYITEYDVERYYRDAKMLQLIGGNSNLLKDAIAGHALGGTH